MDKSIKTNNRSLGRKSKLFILVLALLIVLSLAVIRTKISYAAGQTDGSAVSGGSSGNVNLYENPATGEVFLKPGAGRVKVSKKVINKLLNNSENKSQTRQKIKKLKNEERKLEASV
ncbi:MAG: hypothetical protein ACYDDE_03350, partial [bacterium]